MALAKVTATKLKDAKGGDDVKHGQQEIEATHEGCSVFQVQIKETRATKAGLLGQRNALVQELAAIDLMLAEIAKQPVPEVEKE